MKTLPVLCMFCMVTSVTLSQEEELSAIGKEACACLKEIDPEPLSKSELNLEMLGCISRPIDALAEQLKSEKKWTDTSAFYYLGRIGQEARKICPTEFDRLKKVEVKVDPALIAIKPDAELLPAYTQAVCKCLDVLPSVDECVKRVGEANEAELKRRFPEDDGFSMMMGIMTDLLFELADNCEKAGSDEAIAAIKKFPEAKSGCDKLVVGEFSTQTILGETRSTFTATELKEVTDGKPTATYKLKWKDCVVTTTCTSSQSSMVKKGEVSTMEIKRASTDGFIALVKFGKMKVPVNYAKVK